MFPEHNDTAQWKHNIHKIKKGDLITITRKMHGTSQRYTHIPVLKRHSFLKKIIHYILFGKTNYFEYETLYGSRRVIFQEKTATGEISKNFRQNRFALIKGKLHKNELIFSEIVGYEETGKPIMNSVSTEGLKNKKITKEFGKIITYSYGCAAGCCDEYVYRIAIINEDGIIHDLSWEKVKKRCRELGMNHVPEVERFIFDGDIESLKNKIDKYTEDDIVCSIDPRHIEEGICIRVDSVDGEMNIFKNKNFIFKVLECIMKDSGEEDLEEVESLIEEE